MDTAKWPPHPRPTRQRVRDATACAFMKHPVFFFFFFDSCGIGPTHADSAESKTTDSGWNHRYMSKFGKKKGCKMHHFGWNNKTLTNLTRFILLIFSSLSLVSVLSVSALRLPSLTLNHSVTHTISLSTHSHTHTISLTTSPTHSQSQVLNSTQLSTLKLDPLSKVSTQVSN